MILADRRLTQWLLWIVSAFPVRVHVTDPRVTSSTCKAVAYPYTGVSGVVQQRACTL